MEVPPPDYFSQVMVKDLPEGDYSDYGVGNNATLDGEPTLADIDPILDQPCPSLRQGVRY